VPDSFRAGGNKSFAYFVVEAGLTYGSRLNAEDLAEILRTDRSLIESWLHWSEDKRVSSGWYFRSEPEGWVVAYHPRGKRLVFQDAARACAEFITKEAEHAIAL